MGTDGSRSPAGSAGLTKRTRSAVVVVAAPAVSAGAALVFSHPLVIAAADIVHGAGAIAPTALVAGGLALGASAIPQSLASTDPKHFTGNDARMLITGLAAGSTVGTGVGEFAGAWGPGLGIGAVVGLTGSLWLTAAAEVRNGMTPPSPERLTTLYRRAAIPGAWIAGATGIAALGDAVGMPSLTQTWADRGVVIGSVAAVAPLIGAAVANRRNRAHAATSLTE